MAEPLGHERQLTFFQQGGHDHDGENSTPVVILPGAIQLYHLNGALIDYINGLQGDDGVGTDNGVFPVPDLTIQTPPIGVGASYEGTVPWVGISFVRFMRVLMSQDTECTITFYHKSTYADEDREFRAYRCGNRFLWEGTWAHFDENDSKSVHFKIENTGNQSATFQLTLKSGTMAANAYARFVEALNVGGVDLTGTISLRSGNGVELVRGIDNDITFNATAPETVYVRRWALTPRKPSTYSSSATITNLGNLSASSDDSAAQFGSGQQWIMADIGAEVNLGAVFVSMYQSDGRVFNGVKVEVSSDAITWFQLKTTGSVWATREGITCNIASGYLARYIRVWCNGSTANTSNFINKIVPLVISDKG